MVAVVLTVARHLELGQGRLCQMIHDQSVPTSVHVSLSLYSQLLFG